MLSNLAMQAFSLPGKARKAGWSLEDEDDEEPPVAAPELSSMLSGGVEETKQSSQMESQEDEDDEVDPLDAFMQNLDQDGVVPQETMGSAFGAGDRRTPAPSSHFTSNTISLADLMKGERGEGFRFNALYHKS